MPHKQPYDHTTPPSTPHPNERPRTPRPQLTTPATYEIVNSRSARPAVFPHGSPSSSRAYGPRPDLYDAFTTDTALLYPPWSAQQVTITRNVHKMPPPNNTEPRRPLPHVTTWSDRQRELNSSYHQAAIKSMADRAPLDPSMSSTEISETRKVAAATTAADWAKSLVRKKRRPSEIFKINFSFRTTSQRQACDRTPQISPRSSFSKPEPSPALSEEESFKRKRIDSTDTDLMLGFPFGKPTSPNSRRGRDLGSPAMRPRDSLSQLTPSLSRGTTLTAEAHPGQLIDFASPAVVPDVSSEYSLRVGTDEYHDYLSSSLRRRSFPPGSWTACHTQAEFQLLSRLEKLDSDAERFGPVSTTHTNQGNRKRACNLERKERTSGKAAPASCSSSMAPSLSSVSTDRASVLHDPVPLKRWASDSSTEAFLKHVRASFESRREREYPVYADEIEKVFFG